MVLTEADYNYWYLSKDPEVYILTRCLEIILQSNPLLFIGYSISDVDLLRFLRRASLRWQSERSASNLFLLLSRPREVRKQDYDAWSLAKQMKLGVNLLPYSLASGNTLAKELTSRQRKCAELRASWRIQPKAKLIRTGPEGRIVARPSVGHGAGTHKDPLFSPEYLEQDPFLAEICTAMEREHVLVITGPSGTGKLLKACQYVELTKSKYRALVFHAYNNDDVYAYLKRIRQQIREAAQKIQTATHGRSPSRLLIVINNVDLLVGYDPSGEWVPRNRAAKRFLDRLRFFNYLSGTRFADRIFVRVLLTARSLPKAPPDRDSPDAGPDPVEMPRRRTIREVPVLHPGSGDLPFTAAEVGLHPSEFERLCWHLRRDCSGLVFGALFAAEAGPMLSGKRAARLEELLEILQSNSSEMGTRVVRHILRYLDSQEVHNGRSYEKLLSLIACFNTPIAKKVLEETIVCCKRLLCEARDLSQTGLATGISDSFPADPVKRLIELGLLQEIRSSNGHRNYVVPPVVKRFFRHVQERSQHHPDGQEFGLHGLLSRGPFNCPVSTGDARRLFDHFAKSAWKGFESRRSDISPARQIIVQHHIRAMIDILRSNFACNSVPIWGGFRDYIDMLSVTIDLLRNFAMATGQTWRPGEKQFRHVVPKPWSTLAGVASAEEMLYLYNELGLAYYNSGSVQDALSIWGIAFDWQKAVAIDDPAQGTMYAASLNSHMGMAYMQLGWLHVAAEKFAEAQAAAQSTENHDLEWRMKGMLARIEHFRGNSPEARQTYKIVANKLRELGNHRAEGYFKRHLAAVETRLGNFNEATRLARECKALAASQNAPDLVAFAAEMEGRVYCAAGDDSKAIRKFRIALIEAQRLDISRLQADILLGIATVQLRLGDASAARRRAIEVLELANENLLVLRQVKAMVVLGKVAAESGEFPLARSILDHAKVLAAESQFRLVESDAKEALAELRVGGPVASETPF
jgi:tetratricopeptide (TPR) repeat protein